MKNYIQWISWPIQRGFAITGWNFIDFDILTEKWVHKLTFYPSIHLEDLLNFDPAGSNYEFLVLSIYQGKFWHKPKGNQTMYYTQAIQLSSFHRVIHKQLAHEQVQQAKKKTKFYYKKKSKNSNLLHLVKKKTWLFN